MKTCIRKLYQV